MLNPLRPAVQGEMRCHTGQVTSTETIEDDQGMMFRLRPAAVGPQRHVQESQHGGLHLQTIRCFKVSAIPFQTGTSEPEQDKLHKAAAVCDSHQSADQ